MAEGLRPLHPDGPTLLEQGIAMFEAIVRVRHARATTRPARPAYCNRRPAAQEEDTALIAPTLIRPRAAIRPR